MYSEPCQTCKMKRFARIVDSVQPFTIFAKLSILDTWQKSEYDSACKVASEALWSQSTLNLCGLGKRGIVSIFYLSTPPSPFLLMLPLHFSAFPENTGNNWNKGTAQKMKFCIKAYFSKCVQICRKLANLYTFNEEKLNAKLHFLSSGSTVAKHY